LVLERGRRPGTRRFHITRPREEYRLFGHSPCLTDRAALEAYVAMLASVRARVAELIAEGNTLEEVVAARVTAEHEERYGEESRSMGFVDRVYTSLVRTGVADSPQALGPHRRIPYSRAMDTKGALLRSPRRFGIAVPRLLPTAAPQRDTCARSPGGR
jgi:hypothetical protein